MKLISRDEIHSCIRYSDWIFGKIWNTGSKKLSDFYIRVASILPPPPPYFLFPMKTHIYYKNRLQQRRLHSIFELRRYFSVFHNALSIFFPRPRCIALPENCSILIFRISSFFLFYPYAFSGVSKYLIL